MFEKIALVQQTNKKIYFCKQPKKRVLIINIYVFIHQKGRVIVKLRERERQGVDPGMSLKGHLWMVDGGWWISFP